MTDELERRMRAADPAPPTAPVDPAQSVRARTLVEQIMNDPIALDDSSVDATSRSRRWPALAAAAVVVAVAAVGGAVALSGVDDPAPAAPLALTVAAEDPMAMCIEVTADTLRDSGIEQAFKGTVTSIDGDVATLAVDEWFVGGDAETVTVTGPPEGDTALLGGVALEDGGEYLVSASGGAVRSCGQSGEASPELEALFTAAFGG